MNVLGTRAYDTARSSLELSFILLFLFLLLFLLAGCGNYEGGEEREEETTILQASSGMSQSEQIAAYETTVYPIVTQNCAGGCHDSGAQGVPFLFANPNVSTALA